MSNVQLREHVTRLGFFSNVSVRGRVFAGFGVVLLMLAALAGFSVMLVRGIDSDFRSVQSIASRKSLATDMDLVMQNVRVRVNQWLRGMNSELARQADDLLKQNAEIVAKVGALVTTDKERTIVGDVDRALNAYTASWAVIQGLYADEARLYADKIEASAAAISASLGKLRDEAEWRDERGQSQLFSEARDGFIAAEMLAYRNRAGSLREAPAQFAHTVVGARAAVAKALAASTDAVEIDSIKHADAAIGAWNDAFVQAIKLAATRAARLDSWTNNEGEAMATGANALRAEMETAAASAQTRFLAALADSKMTLMICAACILLFGVALSTLLARSIIRPLAELVSDTVRLSGGDASAQFHTALRGDEIGQVAAAVSKFRDNVISQQQVTKKIRPRRRGARDARSQRRRRDRRFPRHRQRVACDYRRKRRIMKQTARALSGISSAATRQAASAASASEQTATNVQTVAAASGQLAHSINEISRQIELSNATVRSAGAVTARSETEIESLARPPTYQRGGRPDPGDRGTNQSAGPQCHDRGRARGRCRSRLRGGGIRGENAGRADRQGDGGNRPSK